MRENKFFKLIMQINDASGSCSVAKVKVLNWNLTQKSEEWFIIQSLLRNNDKTAIELPKNKQTFRWK